MSWTNADGLEVLMHGEQGEVKLNGSATHAVRQALVVKVEDASALTDATWDPAANDAFLPANAVVLKSTFVVDTAFAGATATLDIGFYQEDGTIIDDDAVDAAIAVGALTANAVIDNDGAGVGARVTQKSYVGFTYDTAAFTAGAGQLIIEYIVT